MTEIEPSDCHPIDSTQPPYIAIDPDLTPDRLEILVAKMIEQRHLKLGQVQPPDNAMNIGLDCYVWECYGIRCLDASGQYPWLRVTNPYTQFRFRVGNSPQLGIYREESRGQPERASQLSVSEMDSIQLDCMEDQVFVPYVLRFALKTGEDGRVDEVSLVALTPDNGRMLYKWPIPVAIGEVRRLPQSEPEGIDLGPPFARPRGDEPEVEAEPAQTVGKDDHHVKGA